MSVVGYFRLAAGRKEVLDWTAGGLTLTARE